MTKGQLFERIDTLKKQTAMLEKDIAEVKGWETEKKKLEIKEIRKEINFYVLDYKLLDHCNELYVDITKDSSLYPVLHFIKIKIDEAIAQLSMLD